MGLFPLLGTVHLTRALLLHISTSSICWGDWGLSEKIKKKQIINGLLLSFFYFLCDMIIISVCSPRKKGGTALDYKRPKFLLKKALAWLKRISFQQKTFCLCTIIFLKKPINKYQDNRAHFRDFKWAGCILQILKMEGSCTQNKMT